MYADGIFETERHHEQDDESMLKKPKERKRRTCLNAEQAKPVKMDTLSRVLKKCSSLTKILLVFTSRH